MKIAYYPGCTLKTTAKNFEDSAVAAAKILGVEMIELPRWNCCGTVYSLVTDDLMHHIAPIRNLIRVQEMNHDGMMDDKNKLVTLCSMCFNTLKGSNGRIKEDPEDLRKINDLMDLEKDYLGEVEVIHFLELLRDIGFDRIREKVKRPLGELRVSPYYGCMLLRPKQIGIDDPERPTILEELLLALGAQVVENPHKKMCCGSYQTVRDKNVVVRLGHDILSRAAGEGAEAIITSCPLCAFNLDERQRDIEEKHPEFRQIPVLYFTQLLAIALGLDRGSFGLEDNFIDPRPLLAEKNLLEV